MTGSLADGTFPLEFEGRINRTSFTVSLSVLLALCWITAAVRFYVRLGIQKAFSVDDGFLVFGLLCLTSAVGLVFTFLNKLYAEESYLMGQANLAFQPGFLDLSFDYQKLITIVLILSWVAISCVKLSFLFLFRKLINRIQYMLVYWWIVLIYVIAVSGYGIAVYVLACPYFYSLKALQCVNNSGLRLALNYAISQITLDIIGDVLILVIPVHLIWKIKISKKQKFWLACSLCLTVLLIVVTIIRVSGIIAPSGGLDTLWEDYWNIISAEVGLILTSATAFRTLYMSRTAAGSDQKRPNTSQQIWISSFMASSKRLLIRVVHPNSWASSWSSSKNSSAQEKSYEQSQTSAFSHETKELPQVQLGDIPRAHMTGLRTHVQNLGHTNVARSITNTNIMESHWEEEEYDHSQEVHAKGVAL